MEQKANEMLEIVLGLLNQNRILDLGLSEVHQGLQISCGLSRVVQLLSSESGWKVSLWICVYGGEAEVY